MDSIIRKVANYSPRRNLSFQQSLYIVFDNVMPTSLANDTEYPDFGLSVTRCSKLTQIRYGHGG
jgi:hypothetical protein